MAALCHAALGFAARDEREGEGENGGVGGGLTGVRRRAVLVEHEVGEREVVVDLAVVHNGTHTNKLWARLERTSLSIVMNRVTDWLGVGDVQAAAKGEPRRSGLQEADN